MQSKTTRNPLPPTTGLHDDVLSSLVGIATERPLWIREAGKRISERVEGIHKSKFLAEKANREDARARLEEAKEVALHPRRSKGRATEGVSEYVEVLKSYQRTNGDLKSRKAVDAYARDRAQVEHDSRVERARRLRLDETVASVDEIRDEILEGLNPARAIEAVPGLPFLLCLDLQELMRRSGERALSRDEWMEAVVLVLYVELLDVSAGELGIRGRHPWGRWDDIGESSLLAHRDGMHYFLGRDSLDPRQDENNREFWAFAGTAASRASAILKADSTTGRSVDGRLALSEVLRGLASVDGSSEPPLETVAGLLITEKRSEIIQVLFEHGVTSEDSLKCARLIGQWTDGSDDPGPVKNQMQALRDHGIVKSKQHRGGGYWLTEIGVKLARRRFSRGQPQSEK